MGPIASAREPSLPRLDRQPAPLAAGGVAPPYAPELNPVEYLWSYLDRTDLANFAPDHLGELQAQVRRGIRRVRRKDDLPFAFLKHSGLYPEL